MVPLSRPVLELYVISASNIPWHQPHKALPDLIFKTLIGLLTLTQKFLYVRQSQNTPEFQGPTQSAPIYLD